MEKGIMDLFMARNLHNGKRHYAFFDWKNSFIVTQFLEKLLEIYHDVNIIIIWDGGARTEANTQKCFWI